MSIKSFVTLWRQINSKQRDDFPAPIDELLNKIPFLLNELESLRQENRILINHFTRKRSRYIKKHVYNEEQDIEEIPLFDEYKLYKHLLLLHQSVLESKQSDSDILLNADYSKGLYDGQLSMLGMLADFYIQDKDLREQLRENDIFVPLDNDELPFDIDE